MKKIFLLLIILLAPMAQANNYVSPETYAVNDADLLYYQNIPPSPKLNIDTLESMRFKNSGPKLEVSDSNKNKTEKAVSQKGKKVKKTKATKYVDPEAYKKKLSYKVAKWWVDQRYKREEEHHGTKHEIKVKARMEYEKKLEEQQQGAN